MAAHYKTVTAFRVIEGGRMGRPITAEARADESAMELAVVHDEALAHCRRMRFVIQRSLFDAEVFAAVRRPLLAELDRFERKFTDTTGEAA